ncbi:C-terminal binding protein [Roseomonas sp. SSH11]|uniref:C-terminal binding protein n=1 Tax=Pararoseomonas baculiformis TaxID=2820812 RepID=A0ABS4AA58_9PROT|nr:C-terminal binding protein [Pararoseomonas baculiformis]MBP0443184.1 C-terminal binding protein [Pararoseomonas baculiformis]
MAVTVMQAEGLYPDDAVERAVLGPDVCIIQVNSARFADLPDSLLAEVEGLFVFRHWLTADDIARFPKLRCVVRMGVGYDRLDRPTLASRGVTVCNLPDYGTTEVADHAIALALTLRRGLLLQHEAQRADPPAPWAPIDSPLVQRPSNRTFGILGLGRIGTAVALRAKAFGWRVLFHDPYLPNGTELALGIQRAREIEDLFTQADTLSIHTPLTRVTRGLVNERLLRLMPAGAVLVNTARGPILDLDALERCLRDGTIAGAGLDVLPEEPPGPTIPSLLAAYRARESWLAGRLIITPHSAYHSPDSVADIRQKSSETMRDVLLERRMTNVILPHHD